LRNQKTIIAPSVLLNTTQQLFLEIKVLGVKRTIIAPWGVIKYNSTYFFRR